MENHQINKLIIKTPIGNMLAVSDGQALHSLEFTEEATPASTKDALLLSLKKELDEYFDGKRREFAVPLAPVGTPFQTNVWHTLEQIPYGETVSYAKESEMLGRPSAVRAVASANGKNPIAILIPCHRVIASNGGIGGYNGGIWRKEFLLELEAKNNK